jgi:hypothetical protein
MGYGGGRLCHCKVKIVKEWDYELIRERLFQGIKKACISAGLSKNISKR